MPGSGDAGEGTGGTADTVKAIGVGSLPTNQPATNIADGTVSDVEFQFINSLSSNAQDQIDLKAPITSATLVTPDLGTPSAGILTSCTGLPLAGLVVTTIDRALISNGSGVISPATTTAAEIGHVNGVTSAIQTQIDSKAAIASPTFTGVVTTPALTFTGGQVLHHTVGSITAGTTQEQGQVPLTGSYNDVTTVANVNDVVTLPTAVTGLCLRIHNEGVNNLQIFPASGDDLGNGVDISIIVDVEEIITFFAVTDSKWDVVTSTESTHGSMVDTDNTDVFVINDAGGDHQAYHTNGLTSSLLNGWTFDAGGAGTSFPIASIADAGGGDITVTTTGSHLLAVGDIISQTNLADAAYVGFFTVLTAPTATTYTVTAVFTATGTGTVDQSATMKLIGVGEGDYEITWQASCTSATNNETFDFFLHKNDVEITGSKSRNKFGTANDFQQVGGQALVNVAAGDKISFALANQDTAGNITVRNFSLIVIKL